MMIAYIAFGGMIGAVLRYWALGLPSINPEHAFVRVMIVNILGSAFFGLLVPWLDSKMSDSTSARAFLLSGVLGSFTTFSAFSYDNMLLMVEGRFAHAAFNILAQVILSLLLFYLCWRLASAIF